MSRKSADLRNVIPYTNVIDRLDRCRSASLDGWPAEGKMTLLRQLSATFDVEGNEACWKGNLGRFGAREVCWDKVVART
jgi:hypothetical protein